MIQRILVYSAALLLLYHALTLKSDFELASQQLNDAVKAMAMK